MSSSPEDDRAGAESQLETMQDKVKIICQDATP